MRAFVHQLNSSSNDLLRDVAIITQPKLRCADIGRHASQRCELSSVYVELVRRVGTGDPHELYETERKQELLRSGVSGSHVPVL